MTVCDAQEDFLNVSPPFFFWPADNITKLTSNLNQDVTEEKKTGIKYLIVLQRDMKQKFRVFSFVFGSGLLLHCQVVLPKLEIARLELLDILGF